MIPRYSRKIASDIWEDVYKFDLMLAVEIYACEAQCKLGNIPQNSMETIKNRASFDVKRIGELELTLKHDVIAFLTSVAENVGSDSRYIHMGMTSSDVLDTCFSIQLVRSADLLIKGVEGVLTALKLRAYETKDLICIGRTHGIHAEPITLGMKFARFYAEFERSLKRLKNAKDEIGICKISGAVGNFSSIDPFVEQYVASKLGLTPETIATQIIPRDRHAMFFATLGVIASSIENIATEIRHLQKSEVLEVSEYFSKGQKGSSAMPHKKNPILSENLTGLARIVRSSVTPMMENVALWHERDISHSSVERMLAPDACVVLDFALNRLRNVVTELVVHQDNIERNLHHLKGLLFSQKLLLQLIDSGMLREDAYIIVQSHAMNSWSSGASFIDIVSGDERITSRINNLGIVFNHDAYVKHVDMIFNKVFG